MCGRYTLGKDPGDLSKQLDFNMPDEPIPARYNIAPSQKAPVILQEEVRELRMLRWGLIPYWAEDAKIGYRMINARAESVPEKPTYRRSFRNRRCLIPSDGFYEWKKVNGGKQPYWIGLKEGRVFCFAGLWDRWQSPEGERIDSFTIITTLANEFLKPLHDRMPVILPPEGYRRWLDPACQDRKELAELLKPCPDAEIVAHPVSKRVNNPANDDLECVKEIGESD